MHFILFYDDLIENYVERRAGFRELHLAHAQAAHERGELVMAGALADPVNGAVLVFRGPTPEFAENFAKTDPYVLSGLVRSWRVRKWMTVVPEPDTPAPGC